MASVCPLSFATANTPAGQHIFNDLPAPVRRTAIDDDIFDIGGVILRQHRTDRAFQEERLIIGRRDDADFGGRFCSVMPVSIPALFP